MLYLNKDQKKKLTRISIAMLVALLLVVVIF